MRKVLAAALLVASTPFLFLGCQTGSVHRLVDDLCDSCFDCSEGDREDAHRWADDVIDAADEEGCTEELTELANCIAEEGDCDDEELEVDEDDCEDELEAWADCCDGDCSLQLDDLDLDVEIE